MSRLTFGVNVRGVQSPAEFVQWVRRADELGFDVLAAPDHLGGMSPFAALSAASMVSSRLRLRTYVLNAAFWNPALLAREVATLDALSGGRAELGIGAGHMRHEFEDAGIAWQPLEERVEAMERTVVEVRTRLADNGHRPRPVQSPVPLAIGAMSRAGLDVAARHAEVISFAGLRQVSGAAPGTFTLCTAEDTRARVAEVRDRAGERSYVSDVLLQAVVIDENPAEVAEAFAADVPGLTGAQVLENPFVLIATDAPAAAGELRRRQREYGFTSFTTHQHHLEALGSVIAASRVDSAAPLASGA